MINQNNWQDYLKNLLTENGQFKLVDTTQKNQTTLEFYKQQLGDKETQIKIGYLSDNRLITLDITNPKTPGHNAEQVEYFYDADFDESKKFGELKSCILHLLSAANFKTAYNIALPQSGRTEVNSTSFHYYSSVPGGQICN